MSAVINNAMRFLITSHLLHQGRARLLNPAALRDRDSMLGYKVWRNFREFTFLGRWVNRRLDAPVRAELMAAKRLRIELIVS